MLFDSGNTLVFPDLPGGDKPAITLAMHQTPGGDAFWLSGKEGSIKEVDATSMASSTMVMDLSGGIFYDGSPEEGLLDFAFNPMFETNGYFYVSYTIQDDVIRNRLSKFQYYSQDPDGTRESEDILLTSEARLDYLHNGGWLGFKPSDYGSSAGSHDLYWSIGDGGPQEDPMNHAQRTDTLFGSVIRISVPSDGSGYDVPSGNYPGELPEICAIGLRSHWRCGFDRDTDDLYCGSVGDAKLESIYKIECGNNYGWSRFEGSRCTEFSQMRDGSCEGADRSFYTPPIFEYCHFDYSYDDSDALFTDGNNPCGDRFVVGNAVIGGYVYRGQAYADQDVYGAFIFADYEARNVYYIKEQSDGTWVPGTIISDGSVQVVSFSEDINGEIMMIDQSNNVYYLPCGDVCENGDDDFAEGPGIDSDDPETLEYEELGCFVDAKSRVLTGRRIEDSTMTNKECAALCEGFTFFGTEYSDECYCGSDDDDPTRLGDGTCDRPCAGDLSATCGGRWSISVYKFV
ncbi:unnamed protein product [Sphacelaria rigidula]